MKLPFKKADPLAEADAALSKLEAQRRPLAERLNAADTRVETAQRARREALVNGDPDPTTMAALDKACADAIEARGGVEDAMRVVAQQLEEATRTRDGLRDAAARAEIAADCERRATALDDAAEALAIAARAFSDARVAMAKAIGEHGVRIDNPLSTDGSTSALLLARPMVMAAVRLAAPSVLPAADAFGDAFSDDPLIAMRRSQSGRLRDHADDVRDGRQPAVEMPRPGSAAPAVPPAGPRGSALPAPAGLAVSEPTARTVFAVPFSYMSTGDRAMLQGEPGDSEVPLRVARRAEELELAFPPDSDEGRAIAARLKSSGGQSRARPRTYIDTSGDADPVPARPDRTVTTTWPDERDGVRR